MCTRECLLTSIVYICRYSPGQEMIPYTSASGYTQNRFSWGTTSIGTTKTVSSPTNINARFAIKLNLVNGEGSNAYKLPSKIEFKEAKGNTYEKTTILFGNISLSGIEYTCISLWGCRGNASVVLLWNLTYAWCFSATLNYIFARILLKGLLSFIILDLI